MIKCFSRCSRCTCAKAHSLPHCAPLENIITSQPMEMVALDYLTLEDGHGGVAKVLVITDHFSKYVVAIPTTHQTVRTTAHVFFETFIPHIKVIVTTAGIVKARSSKSCVPWRA